MTIGLLTACDQRALRSVDGAQLALQQDDVWITTSRDSVELVRQSLGQAAQRMELRDGPSARDEVALRVPRAALANISEAQHREHNRCGGFIFRGTEAAAMGALSATERASKPTYSAAPYTLDNQATVDKLLPEAKDANVLATIQKLSSFRTRFHTSPTGKEASIYIRDSWKALATGRDDVAVELVDHEGTPQPSIKLIIRGTTLPDEIVVLGGHMDSLAGRGNDTALAPGADDNASGIASLTEVVRAALTLNYHPARTVHVYGYAAEEVGLVGSAEIAKQAKADNLNVVGVLQLDMTNYTSASMPYIGLLTDYVDPMLSDFSVKLIEQYVKVPYKRFECGYACSDHASWTEQGFPAAMPHESNMDDSNQDIHTADDTLARSDNGVAHSMHFVRFGLAFMAELAKGDLVSVAKPSDACDTTKPCAAGQRCDAGACVPELDAGVAPPPRCTADSECASGQSCQGGLCAAATAQASACSAIAPCPIGLVCTAGACVAPPAAGTVAATMPDAGMMISPATTAATETAGAESLPATGIVTNAVSMPAAPVGDSPAPQAGGCSVAGGEHTHASIWPLIAAVLGLIARKRSRRE